MVVGGGGHIGAAICDVLGELGARVVVVDVNRQAADTVAARISGGRAVSVDLHEVEATRAMVEGVIDDEKRLDIVVHCAAYVGTTQRAGWAVPFSEQSVDAWDAAIRVNMTSAFVIAQAARDALAASGHGSLVLVSSIYGVVAPDMRLYEGTSMQNPAAYGVSKAGLLQLTRYLSTQFAPAIRVNAVTPGGVWRDQAASFVEKYEARTPLGRMATEEDVVGAVAYLAGDLSSYVTGQNIIVDGGWTAW